MPNTVLTQANIREEIKSRLGGNTIDVELTQTDYDFATKEAVRLYTRYRPRVQWKAISATPATKRYVLDPAQHPGLVGILDVQSITRRVDPSAIDPFNPFDSGVGNLIVGDETYGDIAQRVSFSKDAARVVSAELEWTQEWEGSDCVLYLDIVRAATQVSYRWTSNYTADTNTATGMLNIPDTDTDWILDYVEARCRLTLGAVRRKFGGIPNSEGSTDEVDGQTLSDEAKVRMDELLEDLKRRTFPVPPSIE